MKAMLLEQQAPVESSPLKLVELPDPVPGPGQLRIRVECCALCRTDLHVIEGDLPPVALPIIPGHQIIGRVDQLDSACRRYAPGDRVGIAWLRHTCQACRYCLSGRENLCAQQRFTGYHEHGGYAEYAVAPEDFVYRIPESFDSVPASPLLCAGIIGYRSLRRSDLPQGGTLGLYGFGSSAHIVIQIARHRGAHVYVVTRDGRHQDLARQMGACWAGSRAEDLPMALDSAILFAPAGEVVPPALKKLAKGGTLALAGIHLSDIPSLNYEDCLFYEKNLRSVTANTREDGRLLLQEAAGIPIRPHVTTYSLEDVNRGLQDLKADRISGTGVVVVAAAT